MRIKTSQLVIKKLLLLLSLSMSGTISKVNNTVLGPTCITTDKKLACTVPSLQENHRFSSFPSSKIDSLSVTCTDLNSSGYISRYTFTWILGLTELILTNCKLSMFDPDPMQTDQLQRLQITGTYFFSSAALGHNEIYIPSPSLSQFEQMKELNLYNNRLITAPYEDYCKLSHLRVLNLSANAFEDVGDLGFGHTSSHQTCATLLEVLDLSFNNLTALYNSSFSLLTNLKELHLRANRIHKVDQNSFFNLDQCLNFLDLSDNYFFKAEEIFSWEFPGYPNRFRSSLSSKLFGYDTDRVNLVHYLNIIDNFDFRYSDGFSTELVEATIGVAKSGKYEINYYGIDSTVIESLNKLINLVELRLNKNKIDNLEGNSFSTLNRLEKLEITDTAIQNLSKEVFSGLQQLKELDLTLNKIDLINDNTFDNLVNLEKLVLDSNSIQHVTSDTFTSLRNLKTLSMFSTSIQQIDEAAFASLIALEEIELAHNSLSEISNMGPLPDIRIIRFAFNKIQSIHAEVFNGMPKLISIDLGFNALDSLPAGIFANVTLLSILNMEQNNFATLPEQAFQDLVILNTITVLDISKNKMQSLDVDLLPTSLVTLDVSANIIDKLTKNAFKRLINLEEIYLQNNFLSSISEHLFPSNILTINFNYNKITVISPNAFQGLHTLKEVNLEYNQLTTLDALVMMTSSARFTLGKNKFVCDCTLEWLKDIVDGDNPQDHISDYDNVACCETSLHGRQCIDKLIGQIPKSDFFCPFTYYHLEPPDFCIILSDDRTFCHLVCPPRSTGCHCYHRYNWSAIVTSCEKRNLVSVPGNISSSSTDIRLDGNVFKILNQSSFNYTLPELVRLLLNDSQIENIAEKTFGSMTNLRQLFLQQNQLRTLKDDIFFGLSKLELLWLFTNRIQHVDKNVFEPLSSLVELSIRNNQLKQLPNVDPAVATFLKRVDVTENPWECNCDNYATYKKYKVSEMYENNITSTSLAAVYCRQEDNPRPIVTFDEYATANCKDDFSVSFALPLTVTAAVFAVILIVCAIVFNYRQEIRVLLYSRYGTRFVIRGGGPPEGVGDGKVYDAFVAYSSEDVEFVAHELVPRLENVDNPFRLCLHERNFAVGSYIMESILEAVQCSRRTIVVMSRHFLESTWCRFEFKSAHHHMLEDQRSRLIMIMLDEDLADVESEPNIKIYLKTNTYLTRSDKLFWEKLHYAMPDRPKINRQRQGHAGQTTNA